MKPTCRRYEIVSLRETWRISAYIASGFIGLPLHKVMMHVVGDKAAIKRGNEALLGLSHEKPSSNMTEARTTFLSDANESSLSYPE